MAEFELNGETVDVAAPDDKPLLWVLREEAGKRGTKYGCGIGMCGACTVLVDGEATRSCITTFDAVIGRSVRTIEGLDDELGETLKRVWKEQSVAQCGYCQTGQIVAAHALIKKATDPKSVDAKTQMTNVCRCGTYGRIAEAVAKVAEQMATEGS